MITIVCIVGLIVGSVLAAQGTGAFVHADEPLEWMVSIAFIFAGVAMVYFSGGELGLW